MQGHLHLILGISISISLLAVAREELLLMTAAELLLAFFAL
jgi:hypothetical protein